jgi:hypothetical protein
MEMGMGIAVSFRFNLSPSGGLTCGNEPMRRRSWSSRYVVEFRFNV